MHSISTYPIFTVATRPTPHLHTAASTSAPPPSPPPLLMSPKRTSLTKLVGWLYRSFSSEPSVARRMAWPIGCWNRRLSKALTPGCRQYDACPRHNGGETLSGRGGGGAGGCVASRTEGGSGGGGYITYKVRRRVGQNIAKLGMYVCDRN